MTTVAVISLVFCLLSTVFADADAAAGAAADNLTIAWGKETPDCIASFFDLFEE